MPKKAIRYKNMISYMADILQLNTFQQLFMHACHGKSHLSLIIILLDIISIFRCLLSHLQQYFFNPNVSIKSPSDFEVTQINAFLQPMLQ